MLLQNISFLLHKFPINDVHLPQPLNGRCHHVLAPTRFLVLPRGAFLLACVLYFVNVRRYHIMRTRLAATGKTKLSLDWTHCLFYGISFIIVVDDEKDLYSTNIQKVKHMGLRRLFLPFFSSQFLRKLCGNLAVFISFFPSNFLFISILVLSLSLDTHFASVWCERDSTLFSSFSQTSFGSQTISETNNPGKGILVLSLSMVTSTHFSTTSDTHFVTGTAGLVSMSAVAVTPAVLFTALAGLALVAALFCGVSR
ncbi:hypothetical protein VNO80_18851 [Phaseolus coccineus]|uniref:Uncharacterized protein n=1 Tax=Phaseolus coccineus TaxID=3886 RepID=A0AAN9R037_PHACN